MIQVKCRCGTVEIEVQGDPIAQFFCHCDDCQVVHGAAYAPESVYPAEHLRVIRGEPKKWVLKRNPRFSCPVCSTRLFIDVLSLNLRGLNGYLLLKEEFKPTFHMQCQFAVLPVVDNLPHYKTRPSRFSGSDERVDW